MAIRVRTWLWLSLASMLGVGCLTAPHDLGAAPRAIGAGTAILVDDGRVGPHGPLWDGRLLVGPEGDEATEFQAFFTGLPSPGCGPRNCERRAFEVAVPDGHWDRNEGELVVAIQWDQQDDTYTTQGEYFGAPRLHMDLAVVDAAGGLVADGVESGHYASVARIPAPASGRYEAVVAVEWGTGRYTGALALDARPRDATPEPGRELLPDLVMLRPDHLRIEAPLAREAGPGLDAAGVRGCGPDEATDAGARRCLRFATGVGNAGEGPFETHLALDDAADSFSTGGRWVQRVFRTDGGHRDEPVAPAKYHVVHGHFHFEGMAQSAVHRYDLASQERLEQVAVGGKTGFCFIDGGFVELGTPSTPPPRYFGAGCCYFAVFCELDAATYGEFFMGIGPGWYDIYPWWRADQYVEISGLPDGVYELVSVVDPDHRARESDAGNNEAGRVFRLRGDAVEMDPAA